MVIGCKWFADRVLEAVVIEYVRGGVDSVWVDWVDFGVC